MTSAVADSFDDINSTDGAEIIAVLRIDSGDPANNHANWYWTTDRGSGAHLNFGGDTYEEFGIAGRVNWTHGQDLSSKIIYSIEASDSIWQARFNGAVNNTETPNWEPFTSQPEIGWSTLYGRVRYSEILVFGEVLSDEDRTNIINYLTTKHSI